MNNLFSRLVYICAVFLMLMPLVSCGGGGGDGAGSGALELRLTDASTDQYQAVYVTINEVNVKHEGHEGWDIVPDLDLPQTFNLLELVNGVMADLGVAELEAGHYNQMRLIIENSDAAPETPGDNILGNPHPYYNYLIDVNNMEIPLEVPSGGNTGIKLVSGFDIVNGGATGLVLDFEAHKSIVSKGNGGFSLKPTIKVVETVENAISGKVSDGDLLEGAFVSAQVFDADNDEMIVESATLTVNTEKPYNYKMFLPPDIYNVVVTMAGYLPACQEVEALFYEDYTADFSLVAEEGTVTISGVVSGLATDTDTAELSIRLVDVDCGGEAVTTIEVASVIVTNGEYSITVPAGTYNLVATDGTTTLVFEHLSADTVQNIDFTP